VAGQIDGRILKRGGRLVAMNAHEIAEQAGAASASLRQRAGWW
jgi:hypothetical protein